MKLLFIFTFFDLGKLTNSGKHKEFLIIAWGW